MYSMRCYTTCELLESLRYAVVYADEGQKLSRADICPVRGERALETEPNAPLPSVKSGTLKIA